ncbi:hypothetical protein FQN51_000364 [Onygenales sp. PD_10]|nr:hypothetical protein FQN51_000364 [Onygenales sp. PD_10]
MLTGGTSISQQPSAVMHSANRTFPFLLFVILTRSEVEHDAELSTVTAYLSSRPNVPKAETGCQARPRYPSSVEKLRGTDLDAIDMSTAAVSLSTSKYRDIPLEYILVSLSRTGGLVMLLGAFTRT